MAVPTRAFILLHDGFPQCVILNPRVLQISLNPIEQQGSPGPPNYMTVTQIYKSKVIPLEELHAEKITYALLLYIPIEAFPSSPLGYS